MLQAKLERIIKINERMHKLQCRRVPYLMEIREKIETENSNIVEFEWQGNHYKVIQEADCSMEYIGYSMTIYRNGRASQGSIGFIKHVLEDLGGGGDARAS